MSVSNFLVSKTNGALKDTNVLRILSSCLYIFYYIASYHIDNIVQCAHCTLNWWSQNIVQLFLDAKS